MSEMEPVPLAAVVHDRLKNLHRHLQIAHAGVVVAAAALESQNADRDREVARVLKYCVGERLFGQIERTAELIASLQAFPPERSDADAWDLERPGRSHPST